MEEKIVFIDRDGVINIDGEGRTDSGYITRWEDWEFIPGVKEAFEKLTKAGYRNIVISNQKCVGRGIISPEDLDVLTRKFCREVEKYGGRIDGVFYCPHLDEDKCDCRKPKAGLFFKAQKDLGIEGLEGKYYIGDSERDMIAGRRVGMKTILVLSGKSSREDAATWEKLPDYIYKDLLEAAEFIIAENSHAGRKP